MNESPGCWKNRRLAHWQIRNAYRWRQGQPAARACQRRCQGQSFLSAADRTAEPLGLSIPGVKLPPSLDSSTPTSPYRPFSFHFACLIAAEPVRSFTQSVLVAAASHQEAKRPFRFWSFLSSIPRRISPCIQNKSLVAPLVYCPDRTIMKFSSAAVVAILALCESTFAGGIEVRTSPFRSVPDAGTH
jgi:hypothetical protein